jgi:PAS domain S-box-containing protein
MKDAALNILILEDVPTDAQLIEYELAEAGMNFSTKQVANRSSFMKALEETPPDIILSDYALPSFDGPSALKIAREKCPHIPFIFVTGALVDDTAVELLKMGATDYILKNKLVRLPSAISRALREVEEHNELRHIEDALKESELTYRTIFENAGTATIIIEEDKTIVLANQQYEKLIGRSRIEVENKIKWTDYLHEDDLIEAGRIDLTQRKSPKKNPASYELRMLNKEGATQHVILFVSGIPSTTKSVMSILNITEQKNALMNLERESSALAEANIALKVLLKHREEDRKVIEETILANVKELIIPYIDKLKQMRLSEEKMNYLEIVKERLESIVSPFLRNLNSTYLGLTPREIEIANLVKEGRNTKDIMELLNISINAVDFHRKNLRTKLGLKNKKTNLRSYLTSIAQ